MNLLLIFLGFAAVLGGGSLLWGFPGWLLAGGFALLVLGCVCQLDDWLASIERSIARLEKRWAP